MKLEFHYPTSHMHQILYILNKSQVVPHSLYSSHMYTISSPPQPTLVLHNATATEKFSVTPVVHRGKSKFLCIFNNPISPVQPQFPFHRVLGTLAVVSSIRYEASPKHWLTLHFYLHFSCSFLCLESLPRPHSSRLSLEVAFFVKLFYSPPEELTLSVFCSYCIGHKSQC